MKQLADIDPAHFVQTLQGVANGLRVGDFDKLVHETANRSNYSKQQIRICLGLIAIYWARAILEDLEFGYSDELTIKSDCNTTTETVSLGSWEFYTRLTEQLINLDSRWMGKMAKTFSTEYRQIMDAMPIVEREFSVDPPLIDLARVLAG